MDSDGLWALSRLRFEESLRRGEDTSARRFCEEDVYIGGVDQSRRSGTRAAATPAAVSTASGAVSADAAGGNQDKPPSKRTSQALDTISPFAMLRSRVIPQEVPEPMLVLSHHNGLRVVCLAPGHPILERCKDGWEVFKVDFDPQLTSLEVKGKKKKGMVMCHVRQAMALVTLRRRPASTSQGQGSIERKQQQQPTEKDLVDEDMPDAASEGEESIVCAIRGFTSGHVIEINRQLLVRPDLLVSEPRRRGYVAIVGQTRQTAAFKSRTELQEFMEKQGVKIVPLAQYDPAVATPIVNSADKRGGPSADEQPSIKKRRILEEEE